MARNITGRDALIIAKALYEFVRQQQALPEHERQWSDEQDAKAILLSHFGEICASLSYSDRCMAKTPPDLTDEKEHPIEPLTEEARQEGNRLLNRTIGCREE